MFLDKLFTMPFTPNLERLVSKYPKEIVVAVKNMMDETSDKTVTIFTVKKLITKHLDPLLPKFSIRNTFTTNTTWNSIEKTGKNIARQYSGNATYGGVEYCVGETLRHLIRCCPRKASKRHKLDPYDTPGFCYLCWRHTVMESKFCFAHNPKINNSAYRHGKRLLPLFHKELKAISKYDNEIKAYNSFPFNLHDKRSTPDNVKNWIKCHRPEIWEHFNLKSINTQTNTFFASLLIKIDIPLNESHGLKHRRKILHEEIINNPGQLAGILERCEAWLRAEKIRRTNWGGARANSGRKKI